MKISLSFIAILMTVLLLETSCTRDQKHGYMFDMSDSHLLVVGATDKRQVARNMGSPTLISDFGDNESWIYYSEKSEELMFFMPEIVERDLMVVSFDGNDVVKKIDRIGLNDEEKVRFSSKSTKIPEHEVGIFKSIFSNVGQVRAQ